MHLPDGFLSTPVCLGTGAVATGLVALALGRTRGRLAERQAPLIGVTGAFIFAAQMVNYPIGFGASGHVLGATLAALLLGPFEAGLVMTLVIALQCFLFADGGLTALGANVLNMGFVAGGGGWLVFQGLRRMMPAGWRRSRRGFLAAAAVSSWASVVLAAAACGGELVLSHTTGVAAVTLLGWMTGIHAVIGVGEALLTTAVLSAVLGARPEWVRAWEGAGVAPPAARAEAAV